MEECGPFPAPSVWTCHGMTKETWWTSRATNSGSERGPRMARCDRMPGPWSTWHSTPAGKEYSYARIFPNCPNKLESLVDTFPDIARSPSRGACAATKSSSKPWPRYSMIKPILYGLKCSSKPSLGVTMRAAVWSGRLHRQLLARTVEYILMWTLR